MNVKEINDELAKMSQNLRMMDMIVMPETMEETESGARYRLNERQGELVHDLIKFFEKFSWVMKFQDFKELRWEEGEMFRDRKCGTPVKVRSCKKEHGDKTYFGILLGDLALSVSHSIDGAGVVTACRSFFNPAIFVPELKTVVYGCGSWWGEIESEEEMAKLITDDTIKNVWYMRLLTQMEGKP